MARIESAEQAFFRMHIALIVIYAGLDGCLAYLLAGYGGLSAALVCVAAQVVVVWSVIRFNEWALRQEAMLLKLDESRGSDRAH